MENAYMIRQDGKVFAVVDHPYVYYDFPQMNVKYGVWFYNHTLNAEYKRAYIDLIAYYAKEEFEIESDLVDGLKQVADDLDAPEFKEFVIAHASEIEKSFNSGVWDLKVLSDIVVREANQEFLRERYGGTYKTQSGNRDIYFRISSVGFNWYNIIWQFVYDHKSQIDFVTIVRDVASTRSAEFYKGKHGVYDQMPVDDFLNESGNPVIEWDQKEPSVQKHLALGGTICAIYSLPMNPNRAEQSFEMLLRGENKYPRFWHDMDYVLNNILDGQPVGQVILEYLDYN